MHVSVYENRLQGKEYDDFDQLLNEHNDHITIKKVH